MKILFLAFILLLGSFLLSTEVIDGNIYVDSSTLQVFLILVFAWGISLLLTQKYKLNYRQRFIFNHLASFGKGAILMALLIWFGTLIFRVKPNYNYILFVATGIFVIIEFFIFALLYIIKHHSSNIETTIKNIQILKNYNQDNLYIDKNEKVAKPVDIAELFKKVDFQHKDNLIEFISQTIEYDNDSFGKGLIISSYDPTVPEDASIKVSLLMSLARLNDLRRLNRYLLFCYEKILPKGWLVVKYTSLKTVKKTLRNRYSGTIFPCIVPLHFLFYRVFPKIPRLNSLYFIITKGKNRVISKAEVWGRLHYCGFNVSNEIKIDNYHYVVAQKVKTPSKVKNPSYYPIIKLERVGLNGKIIKAHKIRTMFPYSEFIQKKIFEEHHLSSSGKFMEDFRITEYGKFLRKVWLDELPQIIDWLRGDLKLVGIPALSQHYFSLYPQEYQDLFKKVKPGLIPPIFDESVKNFDEIVKVEYRYLKKYIKNPFKTDLYYLWQTIVKIVFKGVRSN